MSLMNSMNIAFSAMDGFKKGFDVISNNIANVNSIGFKSSKMTYVPTFSTVLQRSAPASSLGNSGQVAMQVGNGINVSGTPVSYAQGALERTEQETDLAIVGKGFFRVTDTVGRTSYLTRTGNFRQDTNGYLVTYLQGYHLQGFRYDKTNMPSFQVDYDAAEGFSYRPLEVTTGKHDPTIGDLQIKCEYANGDMIEGVPDPARIAGGKLYLSDSAQDCIRDHQEERAKVLKNAPSVSSFTINDSGELIFSFNDVYNTKALGGVVLLTDVKDAQALIHEGDGLYSGMDAAQVLPLEQDVSRAGVNGLGYIRSKSLEMSNVDLSKEFSEVITLQRAFQAEARVITTSDEILNEVVNLKR